MSGAVASRYREADEFYSIRIMIPERKISSRQGIENLVLNCAQGGYLRLRDVAQVVQTVGPVEIAREDQVKEVIVRGDAVAGVSVGQALSSFKSAMQKVDLPVGYELSFRGQAQALAEMKQTVLWILVFAIFFSFVVLAVQFNSLKLPALILGCVPFCLAGMVYILYITGLPVGARVLIGLLVVVAATVNEGVLLLPFAEELRKRDGLSTFDAVLNAAKIRLRPRVMISMSIIAGFIPLALNLEEGGEMLQPMADIGATECIPCKMMAPIMEELEKEYKGKAAIDFIDTWKHRDQGSKFGVRAIPTQIFYDKNGKEVFRHKGVFDKKNIVAMLEKLGVK